MYVKAAFSTIIVHAILFIAASVAAYLFVSSIYNSMYNIQGAMIERDKILSDRLKTIMDIDSCLYDNTSNILSLYITNRGSVALDYNKLTVYIDGILRNITGISLVHELVQNGLWERYETLQLNTTSSQGSHIVKVVASNGAYDEKTIYIVNRTCNIL